MYFYIKSKQKFNWNIFRMSNELNICYSIKKLKRVFS